jgi:glycerol-3-phosphate O-acyltransferase
VVVRYEGGQEPLFAIAADAIMAAAYYRNAAIHFLVIGAIAELALVEVARRDCVNALETLHEEALRLRDLLKFEFFFHDKTHFIEELEHHLDTRVPPWRKALGENGSALYTLLWATNPLLAPGVLRPFVESYLVVAEALTMQPAGETPEPKALLRFCMSLGRQRALQQRITSEESAAKVYLENGLLLARARGLLDAGGGDLEKARREHHEELEQLARRIGFVAALAENRRLGLDSGMGVAIEAMAR